MLWCCCCKQSRRRWKHSVVHMVVGCLFSLTLISAKMASLWTWKKLFTFWMTVSSLSCLFGSCWCQIMLYIRILFPHLSNKTELWPVASFTSNNVNARRYCSKYISSLANCQSFGYWMSDGVAEGLYPSICSVSHTVKIYSVFYCLHKWQFTSRQWLTTTVTDIKQGA